jgi:hypothetical protein
MLLLSAVLLVTNFLGLVPLLAVLLALSFLVLGKPTLCKSLFRLRLYMLKLHRRTQWSWPLYFLPVSGGTTTGPNTEIDLATQIVNLEAAVFQSGNATYPPLFQGALAPLNKAYTAAGAITIPPGASGSPIGSGVKLSGSTVLAMTLASPSLGAANAGGQDGQLLYIFNDTAAKAHTITTPTDGIQGTLHVITMSSTSATFSAILLVSSNGSWWVLASYNCTLS